MNGRIAHRNCLINKYLLIDIIDFKYSNDFTKVIKCRNESIQGCLKIRLEVMISCKSFDSCVSES